MEMDNYPNKNSLKVTYRLLRIELKLKNWQKIFSLRQIPTTLEKWISLNLLLLLLIKKNYYHRKKLKLLSKCSIKMVMDVLIKKNYNLLWVVWIQMKLLGKASYRSVIPMETEKYNKKSLFSYQLKSSIVIQNEKFEY